DVAQVRGDADVRRRFLGHRPRFVELVGRQVTRGDVAPGLDQLQHQLAPHPARAARDDRNFSFEALHAADLGTAPPTDSHPRLRQDYCGPVRRNPDANGWPNPARLPRRWTRPVPPPPGWRRHFLLL